MEKTKNISEIAHYKGISFFFFKDLSKAQWSSSYNTICLFTFPSEKKKQRKTKQKENRMKVENGKEGLEETGDRLYKYPIMFGKGSFWATITQLLRTEATVQEAQKTFRKYTQTYHMLLTDLAVSK